MRTTHYGIDDSGKIPDNMIGICWMDRCHDQLHLITQEDILSFEAELKIIPNKQSATRTVVKPSTTDRGTMFKIIKQMIKSLPSATVCSSHLYALIKSVLHDLENLNSESNQIVILPPHKKSINHRSK